MLEKKIKLGLVLANVDVINPISGLANVTRLARTTVTTLNPGESDTEREIQPLF